MRSGGLVTVVTGVRPAVGRATTSKFNSTNIGRSSSLRAERLSAYLRSGRDRYIVNRRRLAALNLAAVGSLTLVALYQMGLIRRVPELRIGPLDADRVDASGEAYEALNMPDALLGLASYAATLLLVGAGGEQRHVDRAWLPIAMASKIVVDAMASLYLFPEQSFRHRALCSWCTLAAAASVASVPLALPEAWAAVTTRFGPRVR